MRFIGLAAMTAAVISAFHESWPYATAYAVLAVCSLLFDIGEAIRGIHMSVRVERNAETGEVKAGE